MNQDEIKMITWRIDRDQFVLNDKDRLEYEGKAIHDAHTQGFIDGLKWVRDGDMHKCIADNKTPLEKGIVFCHTCNKIVGDSFPVDHYHDLRVPLTYSENLQYLGFGFYIDTPENREKLAKDFPPRDKIEVKI